MNAKLVILGSDVCIDGVIVSDPVLARVLSEPQAEDERLSLFADISEIGARVIQRQQDGSAGDLLRQEVARMQDLMMSSQAVLVENAGTGFAEAIRHVLGELSNSLASISGRLDGALGMSKAQAELEEERDRGTAKGRTFEESVAAAIVEIAAHSGDSCQHVGDVRGINGKAGDIVVDIDAARAPSRGRVVFEVKTGRLTGPEALRELDRAREQRDADFAVLVVPAPEKLPAQTRMLLEYGGDKIMTVYDPDGSAIALEAAYGLARARVLLEEAQDDGSIDVAAARIAIEKLISTIDGMRTIKAGLTSVQTALESTKGSLSTMESSIREHIDDIAKALQTSD